MSAPKVTFRAAHDGPSPADTCHERGWVVGTRLVGDEGYGPTIIEITAIGQSRVLAKSISHDGKPLNGREASWVFWCRDWQVVNMTLIIAANVAAAISAAGVVCLAWLGGREWDEREHEAGWRHVPCQPC